MKISIVTPVYNGARFIDQTVRSVLNQQTDAQVQYVVMDGGSTDGTLDILRGYGDRLTWSSGPDTCYSDAINKGWARCDGDIVAWINADDYYEPGAFEVVREEFQRRPDCLWLAGYYRMVDERGAEIRRLQARYKHFLLRHYSYPLLVAENVFAQPSVFMRMTALKQVLPLDAVSSNRPAADYDLWLRLGRLGRPAVVRQVLSNFRYHAGSITGSQAGRLFGAELAYARREFRSHPFAVAVHHLNWLKIRLLYSWWKW